MDEKINVEVVKLVRNCHTDETPPPAQLVRVPLRRQKKKNVRLHRPLDNKRRPLKLPKSVPRLQGTPLQQRELKNPQQRLPLPPPNRLNNDVEYVKRRRPLKNRRQQLLRV